MEDRRTWVVRAGPLGDACGVELCTASSSLAQYHGRVPSVTRGRNGPEFLPCASPAFPPHQAGGCFSGRPGMRSGEAEPPTKRAPSLRRSHLESRRMSGSADADVIHMLLHPPAPAPGPFLAPTTEFVLCAPGAPETHQSADHEGDERVRDILAFLSDPEKARRCAEARDIETPDFVSANEPSMLGKTRGASGPIDDTSDEAYEQLHAKHERAEKRLRRLEKDALIRDRKRVLERVRHIEQVDIIKLLPAFEAREAQEQGKRTRSELLEHLTHVHASVLADARALLDRYNKLLPDEAQQVSGVRYQRASTRAIDGSPGPPSDRARADPLRMAPSLADLARSHDTPSARRPCPVSTRHSERLAFGERVPDCATRPDLFDDKIAAWLQQGLGP